MRLPRAKGHIAPLFFGVLAALSVGRSAAAPPHGSADVQAQLAAQVAAVLRERHVPAAAVAALRGGQPAWAFATGASDLTRPGAVAGADTWFKLGSLTKSVTALAAGLLVDEGRLAWDAPLAQALPELQAADPRVAGFTLRQLLSHRTGLDLDRLEALLWPQPNAYTEADLLAGIAALRADPREAPGFHYSNVNYALAGLVIARAASRPFGRFVAARIFEPLHMDCTMGGFNRAQRPDLAEPHHMASSRPVPVRTDPAQVDEGLDAPAGGLRCSARGLQAWLLYQLSPQGRPPGLSEASWRTLHQAEGLVGHQFGADGGALQSMQAYGLGLQFMADARGLRTEHYGALAGVSAYLAVDPARRAAYAVALNGDDPAARAGVIRRVEQALGLPPRPPAPAPALAAAPVRPPARATQAGAELPLQPPAAGAWQGRWRDPWFGDVSLCPGPDGAAVWRTASSPRLTGQLLLAPGGELLLRWDDPSVQSDARLLAGPDGLRLQALAADPDFDFSALRLRRVGDCTPG